MSIVKCPKCREQVSVPSSVSPQAQVRCPMCGEEYTLQDALLGLPPALIVVHDPTVPHSQQITHGEDAGFAAFIAEEDELVAPAVAEGGDDEFRFAPGTVPAADSAPSFPTTAPAFQFESKPVPAARPSSTSARPRSRKKQGSPVRLIVQTIGGGVMGLIIAQFILWWMPGNWDVSNRDPFGLAAKVAPYAPFLLPANLRPGTPTAQADAVPEASPFSDFGGNEASSPKQKQKQESAPPPSSTAAAKDLEPEIPEFTYDAGAKGSSAEPDLGGETTAAKTKKGKGKGKQPSTAGDATAKEATSEPGASPDPFALPDQPAAATPAPDPFALPDLTLDPAKMKSETESSEKSEKSETPASATATPEPAPEPAPAPAVELKNAPQLDADDVAKRVAAAVAANEAWDTAENPTREAMRDMIVKIHEEMAELGEAVAVQNLQAKVSDETRQSVSAALESVATRTDKLSPLGIWAGMELPNRTNKGAVFYGVVVDHKKSGALHEMQIKLKARTEAVVPVVSTRDLSQDLPAGTNILVVGRMVDAPADNLTGYAGEASTALLHGMHAVVPGE